MGGSVVMRRPKRTGRTHRSRAEVRLAGAVERSASTARASHPDLDLPHTSGALHLLRVAHHHVAHLGQGLARAELDELAAGLGGGDVPRDM